MNKLKLVLDTNYFLHFKFLDEIQWEEVLGSKYRSVHALLVPPVVTELDNHKYSEKPKIRERAGKISQRFKALLLSDSPSPLKNKVELELVNSDIVPGYSDFKNLDDQIMLFCQSIQAGINHDEELVVVTHDINLQLKLKQARIRFLDLDDNFKLPYEKTKEEKDLELARKELLTFQNRLPRLSLSDLSKENSVVFKLQEFIPFSASEIAAKVDKLKEDYPKHVLTDAKEVGDDDPFAGIIAFAQQVNGIRNEHWSRYNNELDKYYQEYELFLQEEEKIKELESRVLELNLLAFNQGTAPASNVDIEMHITVPLGVKLLDEDEYKELMDEIRPTEPNPPSEPKGFADMFGNYHLNPPMFRNHDLLHSALRSEIPNVSSPRITPTNSYNVSIRIKNLKHHSSEELERMYLVFPEGSVVKPFRVEYRILCDELPNTVEGVVSFTKLST